MSRDSKDLFPGTGESPDELTRQSIDWLRDFFHSKLLINVGDDEVGERESGRACAILFTVRLRYLKGYKELWLLNEGGQRGCDRVLTGSQYEELQKRNPPGGPYNPIYVDIKLSRPEAEGDKVTWRFEGGEVVDGTAGGGYEGSIEYGRVQQSFSWDGPLMQTWIA